MTTTAGSMHSGSTTQRATSLGAVPYLWGPLHVGHSGHTFSTAVHARPLI